CAPAVPGGRRDARSGGGALAVCIARLTGSSSASSEKRFTDFIEARQRETGASRGEVPVKGPARASAAAIREWRERGSRSLGGRAGPRWGDGGAAPRPPDGAVPDAGSSRSRGRRETPPRQSSG